MNANERAARSREHARNAGKALARLDTAVREWVAKHGEHNGIEDGRSGIYDPYVSKDARIYEREHAAAYKYRPRKVWK